MPQGGRATEAIMTEFGNRVRAVCAAISFVLLIAIAATPQLYLMIAWFSLKGEEPARRRKAIVKWQSWWGAVSYAVVTRILRVTVDFRVPEGFTPMDARQPFIVIANHRSSLDILVLIELMARLGRTDIRWILKRQLFSAPAIGRSCRETGCGYVVRGGDPDDIERVRRCAALAMADNASVIIFPEGRRFVTPKPGSGYRSVLPPKVGGVLALRREMSGYPVLSVTIRSDAPEAGKTMFDGATYVGRVVTVESALITDIDDHTVVTWLEGEWRRKDLRLAGVA